MKKLLIGSWPYLTCLIAGFSLYLIGIKSQEDSKALFINIAATLLAVPLLFLVYDLAKKFSSRKLNKELFDYAKMQIDREVLSIVTQLMKIVLPYHKQDKSHKGLQALLNLSKTGIRAVFDNETYLGFQVFKLWATSEDNLTKILQNPFIVQKLEDDQTIAIIKLLKSVHWLEDLHRNIDDLYKLSDSKESQYEIKSGAQISQFNTDFPDRRLLLKNLGKDKFKVMDFGDFAPYEISKLLKSCQVNSDYANDLASAIFDVIDSINGWLKATGDEFIVDTRMFRTRVPA
jgi:hypothetical protein